MVTAPIYNYIYICIIFDRNHFACSNLAVYFSGLSQDGLHFGYSWSPGHFKSIKRRNWYRPLSHRQYRPSPAQGIKMIQIESNSPECCVHGVHTQPLQTPSAWADPFGLNVLGSFTLRHTDAFTSPGLSGLGEQHDTTIN